MIALLARRDAVVGIALLAVGIVYGLLTASLPNRSLPNTPGPAFFPWLIAGALILLSVALLARAVLDTKENSRHSADEQDSRLRIVMLLWIVAYIGVLPYAGFLLASIPFFAVTMWLYGERNRIVILLAALIVPGSLAYIFRYGFQILLPSGVWQ